MNIPVTIEIDNRKLENFSELEQMAFEIGMSLGRELIRKCLETQDLKLLAMRDSSRYRNKGSRSTCIKTKCGAVEYSRRVYEDKESAEGRRYTYLLDEELDLEKIGMFSSGLCKLVASSVCESTYRACARQVTELSGVSISPQGAWNIVQKLGERNEETAERNSELAKESQGKGTIETKLLYEENDGIWLKLQGKSREENGPSKEMKVGIAYDGARWQENKEGKKRRILDNKIAYATFEPINEFREKKEGLIASRYRVDEIDLRVINGDGAAWIRKNKDTNTITVLDEFHRNKKLRECVKNPEHIKLIKEQLYTKSADEILEYIKIAIDSVIDEEEEKGLKELYKYYSENKGSLKGYYDRGIEIPETRDPGVIHHARLGSMESNVFTLVGNRMKGRRHCWSIKGANNLVSILCAYHTTGLEGMFAPLPGEPEKEEEWVDTGKPLTAGQSKESIGKGYRYPDSFGSGSSPDWLKKVMGIGSIGDLEFI